MIKDTTGLLIEEDQDHLYNYDNYGIYAELVRAGSMNIFASDITNANLRQHFEWVNNIFKDGIETGKIHGMYLNVTFADNETVKLSLFYYFFNLILWKLPLESGDLLTSEYLFFPKDLTTGAIKRYIDEKFIEKHQTGLPIRKLNNLIDDCMWMFRYIDEYHKYLLNTINNEDTIDLMNASPEFNEYMHADLSNVPIAEVKNAGMDIENKAIDIIKNSDHCLKDAFRTGQGINVRQHKEFAVNIGTKPDGTGSIYHHSINSSFANGGLQSKEDLIVDSGAARVAQILGKENVGDAGHFSRILGLNNQSSRLGDDPKYACNTQNLMAVTIKNDKILNMYKNRWFRLTPTGIEMKMSSSPLRDNKNLIGKTLYFRSPMTCASAARGKGICYRCYGDLAYVNYSLSVGKIAAEILCSILTQMLLSSKHLLESMVIALKWVPEFDETLVVEVNLIAIKSDLTNLEQYALEIGNVAYDDEHDQFDYNAHITNFNVIYPDGTKKNIHTEKFDNIYISNSLLDIMNAMPEKEGDDGTYVIPFAVLKDVGIFMVKLMNAEISRTLEKLTSMIKTSTGIAGKTKEKVLEDLIDIVIEGRVNIDAVHLEVLLSNQMRDVDDILETPKWETPNASCRMVGLTKALTDHPSVTVSLEFEKLSKALYYPLNFRKTKPDSMDLFFMTQPQDLMSVEPVDPDKPKKLFSHVDNTSKDLDS